MPDRQRAWPADQISRVLLIVLAAITVGAAFWRVFDDRVTNRLDHTTLLYLGVAAALVVLKEVKTLAFKDYKIEFQRIEDIARDAKTTAQNAHANAIGVGKQEPNTESKRTITHEQILPGNKPEDPWNGRFGGKSVNNHRKLEADVSRIPGTSDLFSITLRVFSLRPKAYSLQGVVQFFLHPTFRNSTPIVTVGSNGVAELKLTAWGAFTVGVLADEGHTRLELNLAELETAPEDFRAR